MIREFWVENFLSIKERQTISFESKMKADERYFAVDMGWSNRVNKLGIFYGANASGKSNMLLAIQTVFHLLTHAQTARTAPVPSRPPFALSKEKPTSMFVSFYANQIRYDYSVVYNAHHIVSERLEWYPNKSKSLFYERKYTSDDLQSYIKFGGSLELSPKTEDVFVQNTLNNHTVLSVFEKNALGPDAKPIADLYHWISEHVVTTFQLGKMKLADQIRQVIGDKRQKNFYLMMLGQADFNITDFFLQTLSSGEEKVVFVCKAEEGHFELGEDEQSAGTLKFISFLPLLYQLIMDEKIVIIDEIDESLHDELLAYVMQIYILNSKHSQLLFTSQEITLLMDELLNEHRYLAFFVEKDKASASSEYTRGDEFGLHKNLSLYHSYCNGRIGALPELGSPIIYDDWFEEYEAK